MCLLKMYLFKKELLMNNARLNFLLFRLRLVSFFILIIFSTHLMAADAEKSEIPFYELDQMLVEFKATREGTVELSLFRKIKFEGQVIELPYERQHGYLDKVIRDIAPKSTVVSTKGITIVSKHDKSLSVYIIDELADGMNEHLNIGDDVAFEAFHVYNSPYGPGLLIYSWEKKVEPNWFQRFLIERKRREVNAR